MAEEFNADDMLEVFLYESEQLLENLQEVVLANKDESCFDETAINEIFRVMHTIKGSSGIMMFDNITRVSHKLEDVFYYIRESHPQNVPHLELTDHVLNVADFIQGEIEKIKEGGSPDADPQEMLGHLDEFLNQIKTGIVEKGKQLPPENTYVEPSQFYIAPSGADGGKYFKISIYYKAGFEMSNIRAYTAVHALKKVTDNLKYIPEDIISNDASGDVILKDGFHILLETQSSEEELRKIIEKGTNIERLEIYESSLKEFTLGFRDEEKDSVVIGAKGPKENQPSEGKAEAEASKVVPGDYVIQSKDPGKGKQMAKKAQKSHARQSFISVNIDKMDALMELIGELVIAESAVLQNPDLQVPGLELVNFQKAATQLSKITSELQDVIMAMRMMPLTNTFQKMNRIVFDVSRKLGKEIELNCIGEHTEVDKNIIEHISDPLMHLIRNSLDHGIESKEERLAAGKDPKGKITLEARNEGSKVYIIVKDDGKGLNREAILKKAQANGLLGNRRPEDLTDKEVYQFIVQPGFSTKEQVTELSGRGVGMDVVMKNLQSVGGRLEIDSTPGEGSTMMLKIPLTLAIIEGIVLEAGNTAFVVEIGAVQEFIHVQEDMVVQEPDGEEYISLRGDYYTFVRLEDLYQIQGKAKNLEDGIAAILEHEGQKICIFVDRLVSKQEIVVKPIPPYLKKIKGISGCTQLGDNSIALILDMAGIMNKKE